MRRTYQVLMILLPCVMQACRKAYLPPPINADNNYLVVEGVISPGPDSTIIKLSRTVKISATEAPRPELSASVTVESDAGSAYQLAEAGQGKYVSAALNLGSDHKYRLNIATADNKVYQSDFVEVKNSPPIDSLNAQVKSNGVQINVNTHDAANKTRYYRWSFTETYMIHAKYAASVKFVNIPFDTIVFRRPDEQIFTCWRSNTSSVIYLASSAKLTQDVVSQNELTMLPSTSEKIADRYSILVTQYALTADAFNYWQQQKKNSEQLGSIFDAQPSEVSGNIHCKTNPAEPVLGYISVGSTRQVRIYVDNRDLPPWQADPYTDQCDMAPQPFLYVDKLGDNEVKAFIYAGFEFPVSALAPPGGGPLIGITGTSQICADCTLRGTNKQPAFWTND